MILVFLQQKFKHSKYKTREGRMNQLSEKQIKHVIQILRQKFISPFKIIYMIDQKQADFFKSRNKHQGCCTSNQITIKANQQTKIEKYLSQLISIQGIKQLLDQLLSYCHDRYQNIMEKGKSDNLKVTAEVQQYLLNSILNQSANKLIYEKLIAKLHKQTISITTDIGLWATPATWVSKFPKVKLELFEPSNLSELFNKGYTKLGGKISQYSCLLLQDLKLLEKDGKFEQVLKKLENRETNISKRLSNPMQYGGKNWEEKGYFSSLQRVCILLQSIPFELNMKANTYLTVCESIEVDYCRSTQTEEYFPQTPFNLQILSPGSKKLTVLIGQDSLIIEPGDLLVAEGSKKLRGLWLQKKNSQFLVRSYVNRAKKIH